MSYNPKDLKIYINPPKKKKTAKKPSRKKDPFYDSHQWKTLRYEILKESDGRCSLCGRSKNDVRDDGITKVCLSIDHIISRSINKDLELDKNNLQILCTDCHEARKVNDRTDFRKFAL